MTRRSLQRAEPGHQIGALSPERQLWRGWRRGPLQCQAFHLDAASRVDGRGFQIHVSEDVSDDLDRDPGLCEVHAFAMTKLVGTDLRQRTGALRCGSVKVLSKDVRHAGSR